MHSEMYSNVLLPNYAPYKTRGEGENRYFEGTNIHNTSYFNPFMEGNIFFRTLINDAHKVDLTNNIEVEEFCNKYGLPSYRGMTKKEWTKYRFDNTKKESFEFAHDLSNSLIAPVPVSLSLCKSSPYLVIPDKYYITTLFKEDEYRDRNYKRYIRHVKEQSKRIAAVNKNIDDFDLIYNGTIVEGIWGVQYFIDTIKIISKELLHIKQSNNFTIIPINIMLKGVCVTLSYINDEFKQIYKYSTLIQAVGIYFMHLFTEKRGLKVCTNPKCGKYFAPTHKSRKYCPPPPDSSPLTRSSCENTHRFQRYLARKKMRLNTDNQ
jgi:hypothetical protein